MSWATVDGKKGNIRSHPLMSSHTWAINLGEILSKYKDDFTTGSDENGVYFQVNEDYWNDSPSEDESAWDIGSNTSDQELQNITEDRVKNEAVENDSSSDWSEADINEFKEPIVPPAKLESEEIWSD